MTRANGRRVSDSMRLRDFTRWLATQPKTKPFETHQYRGFQVSGRIGKHWSTSIPRDPRVFATRAQAEASIDLMLALRAELADTP